ncbi:hypothetical protein LTR62_006833 [Meristemomyces frigidus]|uniref:Potassium channel domain-containing protein n=1 Tax=Meristemomyces frigidus TaxID=1508187 RepID=A0AAN7YIA6_9PEZI|nr:hypothetical protein LTR62_006833 [Meristemomyces frigidus]
MASAFNICAVAVPWRAIVSPISTQAKGRHLPDPRWLVAINALSIAIAIIANLTLLSHMTEHVRFNISAPITIIGWFVPGVIDIAMVAAAPRLVPLPTATYGTAAWSQAYHYAISSEIIYVSLSLMLAFTAFGWWHKRISGSFKLTLAQRSWMVHTTLFTGYILAIAAIYSRIEGWLFLDAVYFAVVTIFTIGFGDFAPRTQVGRGLFLLFAIGGDRACWSYCCDYSGFGSGEWFPDGVNIVKIRGSNKYFDTIYFTYVAQITVGYGDLHPQTNSTKPAFVFWALLVLPTFTFLIGAVGDAVTDAVNWFSLWVPKVAPKIRSLARKIAGRPSKFDKSIAEASDKNAKNVAAFQDLADNETGGLTSSRDKAENAFEAVNSEAEITAYRPCITIRAPQKVMSLLDERTPREYAYAEWTWLLKLLSEDENGATRHRRVGQEVREGTEIGVPLRRGREHVWSRLGQESPLMDLKGGSEARWVLERLLRVLEVDARRVGDQWLGVGREGFLAEEGWSGGGGKGRMRMQGLRRRLLSVVGSRRENRRVFATL